MGVKGLPGVVSRAPGAFGREELIDTLALESDVVVDAYAFAYWCWRARSGTAGLEAGVMQIAEEMLRWLTEVFGKVIVVFDGLMEEQKRGTAMERVQKACIACYHAPHSGYKNMASSLPLPSYVAAAIGKLARLLGCVVLRTLREADREISALASWLGCVVISNDSDFFVLPSKGYIPLYQFRLQGETLHHPISSLLLRKD